MWPTCHGIQYYDPAHLTPSNLCSPQLKQVSLCTSFKWHCIGMSLSGCHNMNGVTWPTYTHWQDHPLVTNHDQSRVLQTYRAQHSYTIITWFLKLDDAISNHDSGLNPPPVVLLSSRTKTVGWIHKLLIYDLLGEPVWFPTAITTREAGSIVVLSTLVGRWFLLWLQFYFIVIGCLSLL